MTELLVGLLLFLGAHSISIIAPDLRNRMAAKSELGWKAAYSIVSLIGVVLIVRGYGASRLDPTLIYSTPVWLKHLSALLLLPVFSLFLAPYFPGRIKEKTKHPQLVAVKLWAFAHLLVNGTLADILLFGGFLAWAVADRISMKRRPARPLPGAPRSAVNDVILIVVGLALYLVTVFGLHERWFGVAPFPG